MALARNRPTPARFWPSQGQSLAGSDRLRTGLAKAGPVQPNSPIGQIRAKHGKSELAMAGRAWASHPKMPVWTNAQQSWNTVSRTKQLAKQSQERSGLELCQGRTISSGQARTSIGQPELGPLPRPIRTGQINART